MNNENFKKIYVARFTDGYRVALSQTFSAEFYNVTPEQVDAWNEIHSCFLKSKKYDKKVDALTQAHELSRKTGIEVELLYTDRGQLVNPTNVPAPAVA